MTEREHTANTPPDPDRTEPGAAGAQAVVEKKQPAAEPGATNPLTAEEQMARFAKELKENDWGHQPC